MWSGHSQDGPQARDYALMICSISILCTEQPLKGACVNKNCEYQYHVTLWISAMGHPRFIVSNKKDEFNTIDKLLVNI